MIDHPIQPILKTLPTLPGAYEYKDRDGRVLYVGKAKNLRKRVTSYFQNYHDLTARLQLMIDNAAEVEVHTVDTEIEALLLEASLIKKYKPKYNILLKDDKSYSWIKITKDPYPIIYRTRNTNDKKAWYFGPFTSATTRDQIFKFLRKEFPFRSCNYHITDQELEERSEARAEGKRVRSRLCMYYHICRCGGPCEGLVSHDEYLENIENVKKFLRNKKKSLIKELQEKMRYFARQEEFEKAGKVKEHIDSLQYVSHKMLVDYGDDEDDVRRLEFQRAQKGLETLIKRLKLADWKSMSKEERANLLQNFRIECYDISNIQGTNPVGAMVVFEGGIANKSHYRKFKINIIETPNDFAMMREMLTRRFRYIKPQTEVKHKEANTHILKKAGIQDATAVKLEVQESPGVPSKKKQDESFYKVPDLVIIDGGKGQLKQGINVLHDLKLDTIRVSGLAKRREEIFLPGEKKSYLFDDKKEALFLLQRIRDEAHRFGITYHRLRRSKAMLH